MPFVPAPGCAKVAIKYQLFSQEVINTLWVSSLSGDPWGEASLASLCQEVWDWADTHLMQILSNDISLRLVEAVDQSVVESYYGSYSNTPVNGAIVSQSLPSGSCLTIKFATGKTGRSFRGRNYISGLPEVRVSDNTMDSTFTTGLVGKYEVLTEYLDDVEAYHVVVSHFGNGEAREIALATPVTAYIVVDPNIDSQRRRLTGRGN